MKVRHMLIAAAAMLFIVACGEDGADGTSCSAKDNGDGTKTISCTDGT